MRTIQKKVFGKTAQLITALSDELQKLSDCRREVHVALSGGTTPKQWFEFLAASPFCDAINWEHIHFWWGDERCVDPTDPESNFGVANSLLFQKAGVSEENLHRMQGEQDPQQEQVRITEEMCAKLPIVDGLPQFDWVILGVGEDGHTASLFPGEFDMDASDIVVVARHPLSGQLRLSISARVIENARRVSYLAIGASKRGIVRQVLADPDVFSRLPAARIGSKEGETEWWLDKFSAGE